MERRIAVAGDGLTGGGVILDYEQKSPFHVMDHKAALIGGKAYCEVCKSVGALAKAGGAYRILFHEHEVALDGDIVLCECATLPRVKAVLAGESWCDDGNRAGTRFAAMMEAYVDQSNSSDMHWVSFTLTESGNFGGLRCVAHFSDGTAEHGAFGANNIVRFARFDNRATCTRIELLPDEAPRGEGTVTESILAALQR